MSAGTKLKPIRFDKMLTKVPSSPDVEVESKSKLKTYETKTVPTACLMSIDSDFTQR
jgi:hypothetical protein